MPRLVERMGVVRTMRRGTLAIPVTMLAERQLLGWGVVLVLWALLGAGTSLINTPSGRLLAATSTSPDRNLVYTAQFALSHACFLVSYPLAGWLGAANLPLACLALAALALAALAAAERVVRVRRLVG